MGAMMARGGRRPTFENNEGLEIEVTGDSLGNPETYFGLEIDLHPSEPRG